MKTIAAIIAFGTLMISISLFAGNSNLVSGTVNYKVQVHLPKDIPFYTRNVFVVLVDENNNRVAPEQLLRFGVYTYNFAEKTSIEGTRIAKLVYTDGNTTVLFHALPDSQTGKFTVGNTYLFNLNMVFENSGKNGE
ncbi:MAG: hypothetical protein NTU98_01375 [Bacteroidetes bacterium]|nr:hypothetical protein [Bacteroidota bacterium]